MERHEAIIELSHSALVEILQTRILLPPDVSMADIMWVWDKDVLHIRLVGDSLPLSVEGSSPYRKFLNRVSLTTGYWWLEMGPST